MATFFKFHTAASTSGQTQLGYSIFVDALCLLPLKEQVEKYNKSRLKDLSHSTKIL